MAHPTVSALIDTKSLAERLGQPGTMVVDASWHMPAASRDARAEFIANRIPGAAFFDIDAISNRTSPLPHMLPTPTEFASHMTQLGIANDTMVVAYDASDAGLFSAARAWWMLRAMGHDRVAVLDGGLRKWLADGYPVDTNPPTDQPALATHPFEASLHPARVRSMRELQAAISAGPIQIADARAPGRFAGSEPEPRPGLRSGHIPGARNIPFAQLIKPDGTIRSAGEIDAIFRAAGIDPHKPVVTTCGSGVTAAILSLALDVAGNDATPVYDGSWSEWGQEGYDTPVETGPPST